MLLRVVRNVVLLWFVGNHVTFGVRNLILRDTGTVTGKRGRMGSKSKRKNMVLGWERDLCGSRYRSVAGLL